MASRLIHNVQKQEKEFNIADFRTGDEYLVTRISPSGDPKIVEQRSTLMLATPYTLIFESKDQARFSVEPREMLAGNVLLSKPLLHR
jgi:hypothetical protein